MSDSAKLFYKGQEFEFPVIIGTENEPAIDIAKLRGDTGLITIDSGFKKHRFNNQFDHLSRR
jgi:citrate synthase